MYFFQGFGEFGPIVDDGKTLKVSQAFRSGQLMIVAVLTVFRAPRHYDNVFPVFKRRNDGSHSGMRDDRVAVAEILAKKLLGDHSVPIHVPGLVVGKADLGDDIKLWVAFRPSVQFANQSVERKLCAYGCEYFHGRFSRINR
jgi:hypothetical protein